MKHSKILAIPPTGQAAASEAEYVCASELTDDEIRAGLDNGTLRVWRQSRGEQWLQRVRPSDAAKVVHGVPREGFDG